MAENPKITLTSETWRHLKARDLDDAYSTIRHEGVKHLVEKGLYIAGSNNAGRLALKYFVGGAPVEDPLLKTNVAGIDLDGPIGLNPGWDKTGNTIQAWQALG